MEEKILLAACLCVISGLLAWLWQRGARLREMGEKLPGPRAYPLVGNALQLGTNTSELLKNLGKLGEKYRGASYRLWIGPSLLFVLTAEPEDIEIILSSNKFLDKGSSYDYFIPWLGTGLLTSTGEKWKKHRKILTPSFHFKILEDNIDVFNANGKIMIEKLQKQVNGPGFDIYKYITLCALDNICESAMGVKIDAQKNSESDYVNAVRTMSDVFMKRNTKPWLAFDFIFNMTSLKTTYDKSLKILHTTTNNVIKSRREEMIREKAVRVDVKKEDDGVKKRLAFLDVLLESTFEGSLLTDENIREEVDTFMFEGHDTTSSAIGFALWSLSWHEDIQDKVFEELKATLPDENEPLTFRGLQELKYLERVIKETLRMFPSVPGFGRQLHEDVELKDGNVAPKGSMVMIGPMGVHWNSNIFPNPEKFDPERFAPENARGRHPYAYIPFSAGPRNCIGQKFAMLELKSTIAHVVRSYRLLPGTEDPELRLALEVILISSIGIPVKIVPRSQKRTDAGVNRHPTASNLGLYLPSTNPAKHLGL